MTMKSVWTKTCRSQSSFCKELFIYQSAYPHKAALIEIIPPKTIKTSIIKGIPYLDSSLSELKVSKLAQAVSRFHSLAALPEAVLCHWDNQPKNILWDETHRKIYLLDFEHIRFAAPESDLAHLFLFWAEALDAVQFREFTHVFLMEYMNHRKLNPQRWKGSVRNAIRRFDNRRRRYHKEEKSPCANRDQNRRAMPLMLSF